MRVQFITVTMRGLAVDEHGIVCAVCAKTCNRLAGVRASEWRVNPEADTVTGIVKWSDVEMIAAGTETLRLEVARLHDLARILLCRDMPCPSGLYGRPIDAGREPDALRGCVRYPPEYDHRG